MSKDTIYRQAAIDVIGEYDFEFPEYMERFVTELRDAMKADLKHDIEALPSAQPAPQWIPMSEREPESGNYLTTFRKRGDPEDKRDVAIDLYWSGGWDDDGDKFETLAWMPLPEPYKGDE